MKIIKTVVEKINEEIHDAEEYAKLAYTCREEFPDLSDVFLTLSRQEVTHATMLHTQGERLIREYRDANGPAPPAMQAVYDWEHEKMIDAMARIKTMQDMVR